MAFADPLVSFLYLGFSTPFARPPSCFDWSGEQTLAAPEWQPDGFVVKTAFFFGKNFETNRLTVLKKLKLKGM